MGQLTTIDSLLHITLFDCADYCSNFLPLALKKKLAVALGVSSAVLGDRAGSLAIEYTRMILPLVLGLNRNASITLRQPVQEISVVFRPRWSGDVKFVGIGRE